MVSACRGGYRAYFFSRLLCETPQRPRISRPTTIVPKPVFSSGAAAELDRASAAECRKGGQHDYTE